MNLTGKIAGLSTNFLTKKFELTLAVNEAEHLEIGYEELKDAALLDIRIKNTGGAGALMPMLISMYWWTSWRTG